MANPQGHINYGKISNELAEALSRTNFSPYESRIFWAIFRKTYSWHKTGGFISLSQFSEATGLDRKSICRTIKSLYERNIIAVTQSAENGMCNFYSIQKDYEKWEGYSRVNIEKIVEKTPEITAENTLNEAVEKAVDNLLIECAKVLGGSGSPSGLRGGS